MIILLCNVFNNNYNHHLISVCHAYELNTFCYTEVNDFVIYVLGMCMYMKDKIYYQFFFRQPALQCFVS